MKSFLSTIASVLLLLNGFSALLGGWNLILHPDGSSLGMSVSLLAASPFKDFLIPGIVLFVCNGIASIIAFTGFLLHPRKLAWLVWVQGIILLVWLVVQIVMIHTLHPLQFIMGAMGASLILLGKEIATAKTR
jgi:cellulose synthase/poly-beta-1,6-N-acetylglucosamine synthase-like glycosyltransferase